MYLLSAYCLDLLRIVSSTFEFVSHISKLHGPEVCTSCLITSLFHFLVDARKQLCVEVNAEKMYMFICHHQTAEENHNTKLANNSFRNVRKFKMFGNDGNKSKLHS
jgi:hypothetical protein